MMLPTELVRAVLDQYSLPRHGTHGLSHWARVLENGLRVAGSSGADLQVVALFALFHDSRRTNEGVDSGHGRRGAELAKQLWGVHLHLDRERFDLLHEACALHTDGETEADVTVQTCWDADRLDLPRVGFVIDPQLLCTEAARDPEVIAWATGRARARFEPAVLQEWR
ncbi:MAG: hypothetical protein GY838_07315 [bacterium]|nr:hypothetical protein [bacterium]